MPRTLKDESTVPMLHNYHHSRSEESLDLDLEEQMPDAIKSGSAAEPYHSRNDSYASSWSCDTISPSPSKKSRRPSTHSLLTWLRWAVVVGLQTILIFLLCRSPSHGGRGGGGGGEMDAVLIGKTPIETGDDINGLYKTSSHSYTYLKPEVEMFIPNMTSNENRMEIRRNWDLLMPLGSGSVAIPDYRNHPLLGDPITDDPIRTGPLFEASWTHALHCLYYSVDAYHQLIVNGRTDEDNPHHAGHCFEYLRNSILCNLDMTLEGSMSTPQDHEKGQPHVCRNREQAIAWIEARRVDDLQDIVGP